MNGHLQQPILSHILPIKISRAALAATAIAIVIAALFILG
jgi:hypothetical protein